MIGLQHVASMWLPQVPQHKQHKKHPKFVYQDAYVSLFSRELQIRISEKVY